MLTSGISHCSHHRRNILSPFSTTLFRIKVRRTSFPKLSRCLIREDEGVADDRPVFNSDAGEIFLQRESLPMRSSPLRRRRLRFLVSCLLEEKQTWLEVGMIQWVSRDRCEMSPEVLLKISLLEQGERETASDCCFYVWFILCLCRSSFRLHCSRLNKWCDDKNKYEGGKGEEHQSKQRERTRIRLVSSIAPIYLSLFCTQSLILVAELQLEAGHIACPSDVAC